MIAEESANLVCGRLISEVLALAWHNPPAPLSLSSESLTKIAPLLLKKGAGGLAWWRIKESHLRETGPAEELRQDYRLCALEAALHELEIGRVFGFLRSHGLEPLVGKGWAIARHYAEPGLRPYGDIDLYVRPEHFAAYLAAFEEPEARGWPVDLHMGAELDDRSFDQLYAHSQLVPVSNVDVRTFGPEDHLRLLCLHFLREGALRPLWLCDIAIALNSRPSDFDWSYFLSGDPRRSDWAVCALGLAHELLGADVDGLPVSERARNLPHWLSPVVLQQWGAGRISNGSRRPMAAYLRHPAGAVDALRLRWPNPIEATIHMKGPFNQWPRLPFQIGACVARTTKFVWQLPKLLF